MKPDSDAAAPPSLSTRDAGEACQRRSAETPLRGEPLAAEAVAAPEEAHPVFQQALEILRREMPPPTVQSPQHGSDESQGGGQLPAKAGVPGRAATQESALRTPHSALATEVIPARMLNEFVYCPRLFYYEFVEGVFVESADTLRGGAIHQRVDSGSGALPKAATKAENRKQKAERSGPGETGGEETKAESRKQKAEMPAQAAEPETIHSRSVQMGSERLGVVAKMDLVEVRAAPAEGAADLLTQGSDKGGDKGLNGGAADGTGDKGSDKGGDKGSRNRAGDGTGDLFETKVPTKVPTKAANVAPDGTGDLFAALEVCPVDYKAGAPREGEEAKSEPDGPRLWDTDKMQLGLQGLILHDNGYSCNEGVIYYRATKQRVRLPITSELESWVLQNVAQARRVAAGPMPAPLVHSPKCVRCSLAPVCLPDETRMLGVRSAECGVRSSECGVGSAERESAGPALALPAEAGVPADGPAERRLQPAAPSPAGSERPAAEAPPRRLMAARDDTRALYLNTQGYRVGCKEEVLQVKEKDKVIEEVRMRDVSHVALFGNIQISTQAIQSLCEQEIPVTYFSMGGWFYGITRGHGMKNVFLRMEQFRLAREETTCLALARQFVHGKIRNHRTLLMRNHLEPPEPIILRLKRASEDALCAASIQELLGIEGAAASQYFQEFSGMVKVEDDLPGLETRRKDDGQARFNFNFSNRNRRPPTDPVNAMLSLAYSLLSKDCTLAALAVGFDPYLGFYHQPRFGRPALGLDLMEEFRPLIAESTVLSCINNRVVTEKDFVRAGQAVNLSAPGRKRFFQTYEQRMSSLITHPLFDYKVSYRRALELQARLLAKTLTGEIAQYLPLLTR